MLMDKVKLSQCSAPCHEGMQGNEGIDPCTFNLTDWDEWSAVCPGCFTDRI
jgi:hypothetical protein